MGFFADDNPPLIKGKRLKATSYARSSVYDAANRDPDDFYATPDAVTLALLAAEPFEGAIWEPACGDGAISRVLEASGHKSVLSSDLTYRGYGKKGSHDFLLDRKTKTDNIITNPPFRLAEQFVMHGLEVATKKVAIISRLAFLEGQARYERLFKRTPIARVYVFAPRVSMRRRNTESAPGIMAFAWFVWDKQHKGPPTLHWLI